jgi:CDP-diglyceride synthetase
VYGNLLNQYNIMIASIIGVISGILLCIYIHNFIKIPSLSNFIEPFIIFTFIVFLIVFSYLSLKNFHIQIIKKIPFHFLLELLFLGLFSYLYFIIIYYFRGVHFKKLHIIYVCLLFILIHILLELSGAYKSFF